MSPRSVIHISTTFFDPHDEDQTRTTYENYASMVKLMAGRGYPVYRTSLSQMDLVSSQFDRDDHALMRLNEKLKDALDPNGILQPGKSGIWHRRYRGDA
jgi:4-cresol dehydrogenase (hydroxylating)